MKAVFVLLGILAITAAVPQSRGIIDSVTSLVSDFTDTVFGAIDKILADVKDVTSSAIGRGESIVAAAMDSIEALTSKVESDINALIVRGGEVKTCALDQLAQLNALTETATSQVTTCANEITNAAVSFEQDIVNRVDTLKQDVNGLVALATGCIKEIMKAITCAISKINPGYALVEEITSTINGAIKQAKVTLDGTVFKAQSCATSTVSMFNEQVQQIAINTARCI